MRKQQQNLFLISLFTSLVQARNFDHQICTSSCGDVKNISYPFRLNTDPPSCGDKDYELSCQNNKTTILEFHSEKYLVKQISYDNQTIRLVDANFENGTCNLPGRSPKKVDETITGDYRYKGPVIRRYSYVSFFKCSANITHPAYARVPCFISANVYAVFEGYLLPHMESCLLISIAPLDFAADIRFPPYETIREVLRLGLELGWSIVCRDCIRSGASCIINSWDNPLVYECGDPGQ